MNVDEVDMGDFLDAQMAYLDAQERMVERPFIPPTSTTNAHMFDWSCQSCGLKLQVKYGTRFEHRCQPKEAWHCSKCNTSGSILEHAKFHTCQLTRQQVEDAYRKAGLLADRETANPSAQAGVHEPATSRPYQQSSYDALARWRNPALGEW
jgi:hypothetical protein